jgi:dihydroorotase
MLQVFRFFFYFCTMKTLLKSVKIIDKKSIFHNQIIDVLIEKQIITNIGKELFADHSTQVINCTGYSLSTGWVDMCASSGESGNEHKETLVSLCQAAAAGGFTDVLVLPNTNPVVQSKEMVTFIKSHTQNQVNLHPIAALSIQTTGEEMTDFLDLHKAGAVAFSDGIHSITNTAMLCKSLLYLQHINGLLINKPDDKYLSKYGLMHEGEVSTSLGLKGMPAIAEEIGIVRDLKILEYTNGKMHFSNISTANAVQLIREAKAKNMQVTCDIAAQQLYFTDADMLDFDSNLKVKPPFRTENDRQALLEGLADDTIDCIVSAHLPCDIESKFVEFDMADFGMISLQTAFATANTACKNILSTEKLIEKFTTNPRNILQFKNPTIAIGEKATLTLFDENADFVLEEKDILSLSKNSPLVSKKLQGKIIQIFN